MKRFRLNSCVWIVLSRDAEQWFTPIAVPQEESAFTDSGVTESEPEGTTFLHAPQVCADLVLECWAISDLSSKLLVVNVSLPSRKYFYQMWFRL